MLTCIRTLAVMGQVDYGELQNTLYRRQILLTPTTSARTQKCRPGVYTVSQSLRSSDYFGYISFKLLVINF